MQVRLIDAAAMQPLDHSRALGTHARTLELFEQFGFAEEAVKAAADMGAINMCSSRGTRGQIPLSVLKELDTPFPKFLGLPQVSLQTWCQFVAQTLCNTLQRTMLCYSAAAAWLHVHLRGLRARVEICCCTAAAAVRRSDRYCAH